MTARSWAILVGALFVIAMLTLSISTVLAWRHQAGRVPALESEIATSQARFDKLLARNDLDRQASEGYQRELKDLRDRPPAVSGPVRLCRDSMPARTAAREVAGGSLAGAATAGMVPAGDDADHREGEGPDIGRDLDGYARRCEAVSAQLRAVIARVNGEGLAGNALADAEAK